MSKFPFRHPLTLLACVAALWSAPQPARAALVNDYSMTDDVWNTPIAPGHFLIDTRVLYSTSSPNYLQAPTLSLAAGVAPNLELGFWSAGQFTGLGGFPTALCPPSGAVCSSGTTAAGFFNPYVKYQFPAADGATALGLVAGAQIPTRSFQEHDVAIEGVAAIPISSVVALDVNAGIGRAFVTPATLGHFDLAFYYNLPSKIWFLTEFNVILSSAATPFFGQHVGVAIPFAGNLQGDVSVGLNEQAGISAYVTPQIGLIVNL